MKRDFETVEVNNWAGIATVKIPVVPDINRRIRDAIRTDAANLDMHRWHGWNSCGTTHCIAGFAVAVTGRTGRKLERTTHTEYAAELIFRHSLLGEIPEFYESAEDALRHLDERVEREARAIESLKHEEV